MSNLLEETIAVLTENKKSPKDVIWVGNNLGYSTWENFASIANFEYDNGYGSEEVVPSLLLVGKDWWLERHEYDGSEWWEFKSLPIQPKRKRIIKSVKVLDYEDKISFVDIKEK